MTAIRNKGQAEGTEPEKKTEKPVEDEKKESFVTPMES